MTKLGKVYLDMRFIIIATNRMIFILNTNNKLHILFTSVIMTVIILLKKNRAEKNALTYMIKVVYYSS